MKTLEISYLKLFTCRGIPKERAIFSSREVTFPCFGYRRRVANCLSLTVSIQPKFAYSISSASSSSSQTSEEDEETQVLDSKHQPDTARIQFKLKKKCEFGQRFTLVGDDPVLGLWNPCDGVPLSWSDGDVWTADIDIPSGKIIKYKFILMSGARIISWQPGSDRSLETLNIKSAIAVFEDWDDAPQMQKMVEEGEPEMDSNQSLSIHGSSSLVLPVVNQPQLEKGSDDDESSSNSDDPASSNRSPSEPIIADSYTIQEINAVATVEQDEGQTGEAEEENHSAIENTIKTENPAENELTAMKATEKLEDLHWGKKTILKFLANFGFQ